MDVCVGVGAIAVLMFMLVALLDHDVREMKAELRQIRAIIEHMRG